MDRITDYAVRPGYSEYTQKQVEVAFAVAIAKGPEAVEALITLLSEEDEILVSHEFESEE